MTGCSRIYEGTDRIVTDNYANRSLEYYYYVSGNCTDGHIPLLICVPGLSANGRDFISTDVKAFARKNGFAVIAPSFQFDEANWNTRRSYQFPSVWSGNAMLSIIEQFCSKLNVKAGGLYMLGYSAGAQFCLRFSLWKPDLCKACSAYGPGGVIEPSGRIDATYLIGIGRQDKTRHHVAQTFYQGAQRYGIKVFYREYDSDHALPAAFIRDSLEMFAD